MPIPKSMMLLLIVSMKSFYRNRISKLMISLISAISITILYSAGSINRDSYWISFRLDFQTMESSLTIKDILLSYLFQSITKLFITEGWAKKDSS